MVSLDLFDVHGKPYSIGRLEGKVQGCAVLDWSNQPTIWCKNGSSAACTRAPVPPPPPPDGLADYGTARNLLECVPTCESSPLLSLKLQSVQHATLFASASMPLATKPVKTDSILDHVCVL